MAWSGLTLFYLGFAALLAVIYGAVYCNSTTLAGSISKTASILFLALVAVASSAPWLLVLALLLSALGDAFLSRDGDGVFLAGMGAFFGAHITYAALFLNFAGTGDFGAESALILALMLAYGVAIFRIIAPGLGRFRGPVAVYVLAIVGMAWSASQLSRSIAAPGIAVGAALFVFSDTVLALQKFRFRPGGRWHARASYLVWPSYWLAQLGILWGVVNAAG